MNLPDADVVDHQIKIPPGQLKLGHFVSRLNISWRESPYPESGLLVESFEQKKWLSERCKWVIIDLRRSRNPHRPPAQYAVPILEPVPAIPETIDVLQRGRLTAGGIETAWEIYGELETRTERLLAGVAESGSVDLAATLDIVRRLADAVEAHLAALVWLTRIKEPQHYTAQHCINTAILCLGLTHGMRWSRERVETAGLLGMVHDLGKVQIDRALLAKVGELAPDEVAAVRRHVNIGYAVLKQTPGMPLEVIAAVLASHERPDGGGYPRGLKGNAVPVMARLIAVVDAYDAMTSSRPFGGVMTHQEALGVLWRERGRQFDADLVEAFIQFLGWVPPGTLVRLDDGALAVVLEMRKSGAVRPLVRLLRDRDGQTLLGPELELAPQLDAGSAERRRIAEILPDGAEGVSIRGLTLTLVQHGRPDEDSADAGETGLRPEPAEKREAPPQEQPESPLPGLSGVMGLVRRLFRRAEPDAAVARPGAAAEDDAVPPVVAPGLRALVVDDSRTVRRSVTRMLEAHGFVVEACDSGEEALARLQHRAPDLVILDILLPGINGFAIVRKLRKQPEFNQLPIVMMSGNPQAAEQLFADRIGVADFLLKPFGEVEVTDCLQRLVDSGRLPESSAATE